MIIISNLYNIKSMMNRTLTTNSKLILLFLTLLYNPLLNCMAVEDCMEVKKAYDVSSLRDCVVKKFEKMDSIDLAAYLRRSTQATKENDPYDLNNLPIELKEYFIEKLNDFIGNDFIGKILCPFGVGQPEVLEGHTNWVRLAVFSPDGNLILTVGDGTVRVWTSPNIS